MTRPALVQHTDNNGCWLVQVSLVFLFVDDFVVVVVVFEWLVMVVVNVVVFGGGSDSSCRLVLC